MKATRLEVMEQLAHYYANEGVVFKKVTKEEVYAAFQHYENYKELMSEADFNAIEFELQVQYFNNYVLPKILKEYKLPVKK